MLALPHAAFEMATAWSPILRMKFASMPFEAHIVDLSTGLVRFSTLVFYLALTCFALFSASKAVSAARLRGRAARGLRFSTILVTLLGFVFVGLVAMLALRVDFVFELPFRSDVETTSARTRQILAETHGRVQVTCFLPRRAPEFRMVDRLLRGLEMTARSVAGADLAIEYVDPRWELGRAVALVREGAEEGTLVFRRGNRRDADRECAAELGHAGIGLFALEHVECLQSRGDGDGVAAQRAGLVDGSRGRELLHPLRLAADGRKRESAADHLAKRDEVRRDAPVEGRIGREAKTETVDDLVADE